MKKICVLLCLFSFLSTSTAQINKSLDLLDNMRAIHIGGNWGRNPVGIAQQPEEYYKFLRDISVNWIAISVGLHISNSMDATVEKVYDNVPVPTFRDSQLKDAIRFFKEHNLNVMLTLAIETQEAEQSNMPVHRWQLGDPNIPGSDPSIKAENWPWSLNHPQHASFTNSWWSSYINEAVYFAKIAEREGVKMFNVGTETDRLFRTRSGGVGSNNFKDYIKALVDSVRKYFSGFITYDLHFGVLENPGFFGPGSDNLWEDAGFDVVGVSAYFKLVNQQPNRVLGVYELEAGWNNIYTNYLIPLGNRNPGKKIIFLEFGYTDALGSPFNAVADEFVNKVLIDGNGNGKDDGEEQQSNILEAFYKVNDVRNRLICGTFLWGNDISSDIDWGNSFGRMRTTSIRNKQSRYAVAERYIAYTPLPGIPAPAEPANGTQDLPANIELKWQHGSDASLYDIRVSENQDFNRIDYQLQNVVINKAPLNGLLAGKTYFWQVKSKNSKGESGWSQSYTFQTAPAVGITENEMPAETILYQNYPNPFNPSTTIQYRLKETSFVTIKVFDLPGREVAVLVNENCPPGFYQIHFSGSGLASGVYIYTISANGIVQTKKMLLAK